MAGSIPIRVIVVEDNHQIRKLIILSLRSTSTIRVIAQAENGREAIEFCLQQQPDVVLLDLNLPGVSSIATIQEILRGNPQIRIVILSAFLHPADAQAALEAGAVECLEKSATPEMLVEAILHAYDTRAR